MFARAQRRFEPGDRGDRRDEARLLLGVMAHQVKLFPSSIVAVSHPAAAPAGATRFFRGGRSHTG